MSRNWTPAQLAAMKASGRTLLISAAAGSGKTATLTERIIRRLTDPEHPADLSRMLIVTFTRAAAAELKERIAGALSAAISADPCNRHLQKQLLGLGSAHISTIDAFVREPVKAHFAELGLSASGRIADEAELAPLRERVMDELIGTFYIKYASAPTGELFSLLSENPFADLCDSLTPSKNDETLIPTLLSLYERLLAHPEGLERLRMEAETLEKMASSDFFASAHGGMIAEWVKDFCASAEVMLCDALRDISADEKAYKAYGSAFEADLTFICSLGKAQTYAVAYSLFASYQNERLGALRGATTEMIAHKEARAELVKTVKAIGKTYFVDPPETVADQMHRTALMCRVLYDYLSEYDRRILAEKEERGISDFTDNRRYLLRLLRSPDGTPTALGSAYADRFDEVYIDEYQDVDEMQDEIFRIVGGDRRFMVGDIKQSIYGFRGADPSVFARYRRTLLPLDPAHVEEKLPEGAAGSSIFMSENFRCDESVIRVTNAVCGHILRACPQTVGYVSADDLGFSKLSPTVDYVSPRVEIAVLTKPPKEDGDAEEASDPTEGGDLSGVETEAMFVANEIAALLRSGEKLASGDPIRPKDIVILMRAGTSLAAYREALTAMGIPTGSDELDTLEAGRDILHGGDMMYLLNLLRVIDNPDMDIPLSETLRAPFPGLSLEDMLALRQSGADGCSLYECLENYPKLEDADGALTRKATEFMAWIERYRELCETQPADGILRLLSRDERCAGRHTEAYRYLYESARTCRTATFVSLYAFLRYFEKKLLTTKNAAAASGAENEDGHVTLMTIHRSKGLEFPVCFVVRCGQAFSRASMAKDLIFDKRVGVSMKLYRRDDDNEGKQDTTLRAAGALAVKLSEREEEMRVLYVAMTRARERLYLVGLGSQKPVTLREGDRYAALSCSSYLKWIIAGVSAHPEVNSYCRVQYISTTDVIPDERLPAGRRTTVSAEEDQAAARYRAISDAVVPPCAMELRLSRVPTKVPASGMSAGLLDRCVFYETDLPDDEGGKLPDGNRADGETYCDPRTVDSIRESLRLMSRAGEDVSEFELLLGESRRPTAGEKGTAAHLFLQYCDYARVMKDGTPAGLDEEIARLGAEGFLNERTVRILDRATLRAFFESRFFARMRGAVKTERELKFHRFVRLAELTADPAFAEALGDRTLYVQGSIDLLCEFEDGHLELCDYKTDRITDAERRDPSLLSIRMAERHGEQLRQYAAAVAEMYGRRPEHMYIYSLPLGDAVEIEV